MSLEARPRSCFLIRKKHTLWLSLEGRTRLCSGSDRGAGMRQQGSDRKCLDLLPVAILPLASWPACSSSISVACKGLLSSPLLSSPPCPPRP